MYINALKDLIKDLVNLCGEETDPTVALKEIEKLENKINNLEQKGNLDSFDNNDLEIAKVSKEYWENSATFIGNKIILGFEKGENKEKLIDLFNTLFDKASASFKELNELLVKQNFKTIWDAINKRNLELIKAQSKTIKNNGKNYSNVTEHYQNKKELIENVIKSLNEKKIIVDETIAFYHKIIDDIATEIRSNNDTLLIYNDRKYMMAYSLCKQEDYTLINEEIEKLRQIKEFNETQMKKFNSELETILKEKEGIEKEIKLKKVELEQTEKSLKEYKEKTLEGTYISKEEEVLHEFDIIKQEKELNSLNLQKNLIYISLDRIKEMGIEIILNYSGASDETKVLEGEFTQEEINQIEDMMNILKISKEEAIKTIEVSKAKEEIDGKITEYMNEFGFSLEEAKEAIEKEPSNKFWIED